MNLNINEMISQNIELNKEECFIADDGLYHCKKCKQPRQYRFHLNCAGKEINRVIACQCSCQMREDERDHQRRIEKMKRRKLEQRIANAFVSLEMRKLTFSVDDGKTPGRHMAAARGYAEKLPNLPDFGLLFFGKPSGGKTFLACCIANAAIDAGVDVVMRSVPQMMEAQDIQQMIDCELLIIDDLGAERSTSYGQEKVYRIIDGRYQNNKPCIVTTNLTRRELAKPQDVTCERIYSRLLEKCVPIEVETGRSRISGAVYEERLKQLGLQ